MPAKHERDYTYCTHCPKMCRFACPVSNADFRETHTPWGKMAAAREFFSGAREADNELLRVLSQCLGCRLCQTYCDHEIDVSKALREARSAVIQTIGPGSTVLPSVESLLLNGITRRKALVDLLGLEWFRPNTADVYLPACELPDADPEYVKSNVKMLERLEVSSLSVFNGDAGCCGHSLYAAGHTEAFVELARRNVVEFNRFKRVVCDSPECAYTIGTIYREFGLPVTARVMHMTEFLQGYIDVVRFRSLDGTHFYHDSCVMGRHLELYDLPRELLRRTLRAPLREFQWNRESSYCCGAGGVFPLVSPETAERVAERAIATSSESGEGVVVSFSPRCVWQLRRNAPAGVRVEHGLSVLAAGLRDA
ncbi:MAG: (Fe-S)-binding protein [Myxococcales bacterium]|nr:(Fe-S)-binding protein [Myxococcales bacterium]